MLNKVQLIGRLGTDPEVRYTQGGDAIANLRVATTEVWKDRNTGERKEATEWHQVVLYRRQAEVAGEYLKKGSKVYFEGRLRTRKWQDKEGQDRYTTVVQASNLIMLDGRDGSQQSEQGRSQAQKPQSPNNGGGGGGYAAMPTSEGFDSSFDDEIPFLAEAKFTPNKSGLASITPILI